jgi:hypothetical protein
MIYLEDFVSQVDPRSYNQSKAQPKYITSLPRTSSRLKTMQTWWCKWWSQNSALGFGTQKWRSVQIGIALSAAICFHNPLSTKTHTGGWPKRPISVCGTVWHILFLWTFGLSTKRPTGGFLGFKAHLLGMLRGPWESTCWGDLPWGWELGTTEFRKDVQAASSRCLLSSAVPCGCKSAARSWSTASSSSGVALVSCIAFLFASLPCLTCALSLSLSLSPTQNHAHAHRLSCKIGQSSFPSRTENHLGF